MYGSHSQKNRVHVHEYQFELFTSRGELQLKFPCTFFLVWKTGKYSTQDLQAVAPEGSLINFNSHLELVSEVAYNEMAQVYIEKRSYIEVYLNSLSRANAPKLAGVVSIDLAQVLNNNTYDKPKQYSIERCPDKTSNLTFYIKSKFLRELGIDEMRDISFSFQNEADQMEYIMQTLSNTEHTRSPARSHTGVHTQHYREPASSNKVSQLQQNPTRNEIRNIMEGRQTNPSLKDKDGAASRASSRNRELVSSAVGSFDVERIKQMINEPTRSIQKPKNTQQPTQMSSVNPNDQTGKQKKDRLTWINRIEESAISRRNQIKDSTMKDQINRWREECSILKSQLESQKQFRLKLESELEASRMENSSQKGVLRDLQRKLSEVKELDNSTLKRMRDNLNDHERKLILANDQVERLKMINSRLEASNATLNRQVQEMSSQHSKQIIKFDNELANFKRELTNQLQRQRREASEIVLSSLTQELERTKQKLKKTQDTAYQYRLQIVEKDAALDFAEKNFKSPHDSPFKNKLDDWRIKEIQKLQNTIMTKDTEINSLRHELSLLNGKLESIRAEKRKRSDFFKNLEEIGGKQESQIQTLKQQIAIKNQTIFDLNASIERMQPRTQITPSKTSTQHQQNIFILRAQLDDYKLKNVEFQRRVSDLIQECRKKETIYGKVQADLTSQIDQHLKRIEELENSNSLSKKLLQIDNSPVQSVESRIMNEESLKKLIPLMTSAEVQTDQIPQGNDKQSSKVIQNLMLREQSPSKSLNKEESPRLQNVEYCFSYLQSPIEYVQLPLRQVVEPIPNEFSMRVREYELRIKQLQCEMQNKSWQLDRKNEQLEEMAQLKTRTEQYQQESWNLRCLLEQQLEQNSKLKEKGLALELKNAEVQKKYKDQLINKGSEIQLKTQQDKPKIEKEITAQPKQQTDFACQTQTQSLQLQNLELKFQMQNLREKAQDYEQSTNELYEQLRKRDDRERELEQSVRKLEERIHKQESVKTQTISNSSMMRLSQPLRKQPSLPSLEETLQQLEGVFGGKPVQPINEIWITPTLNKKVRMTRSIQRTTSIAIDPIIEHPEEMMSSDTENHRLPPTMLLSQLLVLKSKLSHSEKMVDMTMTEKMDRQLIIKYLEDKVNRQKKKLQKTHQDLFKTKAHLESATKKNQQFRSKFLALRPKKSKAANPPLVKRLSIQSFPSRMSDSEQGSLKNNQSLDIIRQEDGESARTDPVEHADVDTHLRSQDVPLQKTRSVHELECLHAEIDALNEQIKRLNTELTEKDSEVSTSKQKIEQLKIENFELKKCIQDLKRDKQDSPVRLLEQQINEKIIASPVTENLQKLQREIENLKLQNDVFVRMFRNAHARKEGTATEIETLKKQLEELQVENARLDKLNNQYKHQIEDLQNRVLVSGIMQSPICRDAAQYFHDDFEWNNNIVESKDKDTLIYTLNTRNRILAERLRFVSNDRRMLQEQSRRLGGQIQRVRTKLINDCVLVEQKRDMINTTKPLDTLLKQMLIIFDNPQSAVIASEESSEMASSLVIDSAS